MHAAIERQHQRLERLEPNARVAFRQDIRAQRHRRADIAHRQRLAHTSGVAPQQIELEGRQVVTVDPRFSERTKAGVDAVDGLVALGARIDHGTRGVHARTRRRRNRDLLAAIGDRDEIVDGEVVAGQLNHTRDDRPTSQVTIWRSGDLVIRSHDVAM